VTPLHIHLMLHFYAIAEPYIPAPRSSIASVKFTQQLINMGLISVSETSENGFRCTERGECYVEALKKLPLPEAVTEWRIPNGS
jgi:hypothetical protein